MSKLREVSIAYLQAPTTFPGVFQTETTLSKEKTPHAKFYESSCGGLWVETKLGNAIIPATNVKIMMFKGGDEVHSEAKPSNK